jgi:hypothetical protein
MSDTDSHAKRDALMVMTQVMTQVAFAIAVVTIVSAAQPGRLQGRHEASIPEMERLAALFVGDWTTSELMERSEFFPNGGRRTGTSQWRMTVDGTALTGEGHSDGSAGPLSYLMTIWWDGAMRSYRFFACFRDAKGSSCGLRGTAHWEGATFINEYEEWANGQPVKWRDSFIELTARSHRLIAARESDDGTMRTLITTRSVRR